MNQFNNKNQQELNEEFLLACQGTNIQYVRELINMGVDLNARSVDASTGLIYASRFERYEIVKLLLENDAEINIKNNLEITPLIAACLGGLEIPELLIKSGADVNATDFNDTPALMYAPLQDNYKLAEMLLKNGANPNLKNKNGYSALNNPGVSYEIAELLLKNGADANSTSNAGETPYMMVTAVGSYSVAGLLINHGANKKTLKGKEKEGCYIATAVYGSYNSPQVLILREFRDRKLLNNFGGKIFIKTYYFISPFFVRYLKQNSKITILIKRVLDRFINKLSKNK